jgi:glutamine amidotransferase-like uncharacterized protein
MKSRTKFMKILAITIILLISITPNTVFLVTNKIHDERYPSLAGVRVAIYHGNAVLGAADSYVALEHMFKWMGASVDYISPKQVQDGGLITYKIFVMPGGSPDSYAYELGDDGMANIKSFVEMGGVYFGICGGAILALGSYLNLFTGYMYPAPIPGSTGTSRLINMTVNRNSAGPNLSNEPKQYCTLYWGSMYFDHYGNDVVPIMKYPQNDKPGMIAFQKGLGTVFISSPHPEFEEGSTRDGTTSFDSYNDPDSEWGLLLKVSKWLVDTSNFKLFLLWFGISVIVILAFIGIIILKKKRSLAK